MRDSVLGNEHDDPEIFPWDDVRAAQQDAALQAEFDFAEIKREYRAQAQPCPQCGNAADALTWLYFSSPEWTWQHLCGRAGILQTASAASGRSTSFSRF
jgi:hypothetical protein